MAHEQVATRLSSYWVRSIVADPYASFTAMSGARGSRTGTLYRALLWSIRTAILAMCLLPLPSALAAGDADTAVCSAAVEASPGFRTYLPDCRAYEMVTPSYKDGGVINAGISISADGLRVVGTTTSAFAGIEDDQELDAYYEFQREATGWVTSPLSPPASLFPKGTPPNGGGLPADANLGDSIWNVTTIPALGAEEDSVS